MSKHNKYPRANTALGVATTKEDKEELAMGDTTTVEVVEEQELLDPVVSIHPSAELTQEPLRAREVGRTERDDRVVIRPREHIKRMRFGPDWYNFEKGKRYTVDSALAKHLEEKGLI